MIMRNNADVIVVVIYSVIVDYVFSFAILARFAVFSVEWCDFLSYHYKIIDANSMTYIVENDVAALIYDFGIFDIDIEKVCMERERVCVIYILLQKMPCIFHVRSTIDFYFVCKATAKKRRDDKPTRIQRVQTSDCNCAKESHKLSKMNEAANNNNNNNKVQRIIS